MIDERLLQAGLQAMQDSNLPVAEQVFSQLVAQEPRMHQAWNMLAIIATMSGMPDVGLQRARQALSMDRRNPNYLNTLAVSLGELGQLDEAKAALQKALREKPTYAEAHYNLAWVLLLANVFWAIAYDTEYAMVDRDDDMKLNLKSSALLFGVFDVALTMVFHGLFLAVMAGVGLYLKQGLFYFLGLALAAALIACQYRMIRRRDRDGCFRAFMNNNWVGAAVFAGLALDYYFMIPVIK